MKTKQIRKISEVPSWFNYSNYKAFSSLTLEQYIEQIIIRVGLIHTITEDDEIFEPLFDSPLWLKIKSESPILKFELDNSFQTREQIIFNYNAIESVDYDMAHTCCMSAESIVEESHESNNIPPSIETAFKEVIGDRNQWLSINLHEATDDEILNELRS
ncbi:DUF6387 family protein, partial [Vibrio sp.]|uniref:DUF6387 family protein n=1 Tax=Vibrio sp. TaxID=678 RepID=UPI003F6D2D6C